MTGSGEAHAVAGAAPATVAAPLEGVLSRSAVAPKAGATQSATGQAGSTGSHGAQKLVRRGGGMRFASSAEHRWLEWPHDDRASPPLALPSPPTAASAGRPASGYIGVYTTGADGVRVFRADPWSLSARFPGPDRR
jgi:hypothetical protein